MKKLIAAFFIILAACTPKPAELSTATSTALVVPQQSRTPAPPTRIPNIVSPTPSPTATPLPTPSVYVVKAGDTMTTIAQKFGVPVLYLADLNGINNPNYIKAGDVLRVSGTVQYPAAPLTTGKVILAILGKQRGYAFGDGVLLKELLVSTGRAQHETVTGIFRVQAKYTIARMVGPDYDVLSPWTQYFGNDVISWHDGYSFHGAPWNHDLGTPHSHGCLNMSVDDAKWLFDWTDPVSTGGITISPDLNTGTLIVITQ